MLYIQAMALSAHLVEEQQSAGPALEAKLCLLRPKTFKSARLRTEEFCHTIQRAKEANARGTIILESG